MIWTRGLDRAGRAHEDAPRASGASVSRWQSNCCAASTTKIKATTGIYSSAHNPDGRSATPLCNNCSSGCTSPLTVHGFRSSFRDWAGERTAFPHDVCEAALAHIKGKTERAYQRGDLFSKRRKLMEAWGRFAAAPPAKQETGGDLVPMRLGILQ